MTKATEAAAVQESFLYLGTRMVGKDPCTILIPMTDAEIEAGEGTDQLRAAAWRNEFPSVDARIYTKGRGQLKSKLMSRSGGLYSALFTEKTIDLTSITYTGLWPNDEDRSRWQNETWIVENQHALEKSGRLDTARLAGLEPYRLAYKSARGIGKNMILAEIVRAVTGSKALTK